MYLLKIYFRFTLNRRRGEMNKKKKGKVNIYGSAACH